MYMSLFSVCVWWWGGGEGGGQRERETREKRETRESATAVELRERERLLQYLMLIGRTIVLNTHPAVVAVAGGGEGIVGHHIVAGACHRKAVAMTGSAWR